jgi:hypothetical protein
VPVIKGHVKLRGLFPDGPNYLGKYIVTTDGKPGRLISYSSSNDVYIVSFGVGARAASIPVPLDRMVGWSICKDKAHQAKLLRQFGAA